MATLKRYNIYETRDGWGYPFMRGMVRARTHEGAASVVATLWGPGLYRSYLIRPTKGERIMKNLLNILVLVAVLLPAKAVRQRETETSFNKGVASVAAGVARASSRGRYAVAVYLPTMREHERGLVLSAVRAKGYGVSDGSGVNEVLVSW
jgi:hypothetical protein